MKFKKKIKSTRVKVRAILEDDRDIEFDFGCVWPEDSGESLYPALECIHEIITQNLEPVGERKELIDKITCWIEKKKTIQKKGFLASLVLRLKERLL